MQHELEKFLSVVECGGFIEAAQKMHISQPALSIAIKNLEKSLGAQLLLRSSTGNRLTGAGRVVFEHAKLVRLESENLLSELNQSLRRQRLHRVGMIDSIAEQLYGHKNTFFDIEIEATVDNSVRLIEAVTEGNLDIALTTKSLDKLPARLKEIELGVEKFVLVVSSDLYGRSAGNLKVGKLDNFLAYDRSSNTGRRIHEGFIKQGVKVKSIFHSTSPELLRKMAINSRGVAMLPLSKVNKDLEAKRLRVLRGYKFARPISAVVLSGKFITKEMLEILKETGRILNGT